MSRLACRALSAAAAAVFSANPVHAAFMDCDGAPLCGVLTLETGLGRGVYEHREPALHGLWPQTGKYGSSQCIAPTKSEAGPGRLFPCYESSEVAPRKQLQFEVHEWEKHGTCAGTRDAEDYLQQACELSGGPLRVLAAERRSGALDLDVYARALGKAGYHVSDTDQRTMQLELSACASNDGRWTLASPADFRSRCAPAAGSSSSSTAPAVQAVPAVQQCKPSARGPSCSADGDCGGYSGCLRCAKSGG